MTKKEFERQPGLVRERQAQALGYSRSTLAKFVDCRVLRRERPPGCKQAYYQKRQLALLVGWPDIVARDEQQFRAEPPVMRRKAVMRWTGLSKETLAHLAANGARQVRPPGSSEGKWPKQWVAKLIGLEHCL